MAISNGWAASYLSSFGNWAQPQQSPISFAPGMAIPQQQLAMQQVASDMQNVFMQHLSISPIQSFINPIEDKRFKRFSSEGFKNISNTPVIKNILSAAVKIDSVDRLNRIKEHLATL